MSDTRKIVLWSRTSINPDQKAITGTDKAYVFCESPSERKERAIWIPRSLIHHVSRDVPDANGWQRCVIEVEEWWLDKNKL